MTFALAPGPASFVVRKTLPLPEPNPSVIQSSVAVAFHDPALGAEHPRLLREVLGVDEAQLRVLADDELHDAVDDALGLGVGRQRLMPDLGLRTLLQHDQRAVVQRRARGLVNRRQHDRRLDVHSPRDVHERAVGPAGVVAHDERCVGGDQAAQVLLHDVGMTLRGQRQRHDHRPLGHRLRVTRPDPALEIHVQDMRRRIRRAAGSRRERIEIQLVDRRELPPINPPELRQRKRAKQGRSRGAAIRKELRFRSQRRRSHRQSGVVGEESVRNNRRAPTRRAQGLEREIVDG